MANELNFHDKFKYGIGEITDKPAQSAFHRNKFVVAVDGTNVLYFADPMQEYHRDIIRRFNLGNLPIIGGGRCLPKDDDLYLGEKSGDFGGVSYYVLERLVPSLEKAYMKLFGHEIKVNQISAEYTNRNYEKLRMIAQFGRRFLILEDLKKDFEHPLSIEHEIETAYAYKIASEFKDVGDEQSALYWKQQAKEIENWLTAYKSNEGDKNGT
jgi:hypothetical protein